MEASRLSTAAGLGKVYAIPPSRVRLEFTGEALFTCQGRFSVLQVPRAPRPGNPCTTVPQFHASTPSRIHYRFDSMNTGKAKS